MKKYLFAGILLLTVVATSCSNPPVDQKKIAPADGKSPKIAKQYTCTMHPDIIADKPGVCSKCGMDLVEKK